jgi:hypothetical protein
MLRSRRTSHLVEPCLPSQFPLAAEAVRALPANSFLLDGKPSSPVPRASGVRPNPPQRNGGDRVLIAFNLIELEGEIYAARPLS